MRKTKRKVSYLVESETVFDKFEIVYTTMGWWKDARRVKIIIEATKRGKSLKQCWHFAGITKKQWRCFAVVHPAFNQIRRDVLYQIKRPELHFTHEGIYSGLYSKLSTRAAIGGHSRGVLVG